MCLAPTMARTKQNARKKDKRKRGEPASGSDGEAAGGVAEDASAPAGEPHTVAAEGLTREERRKAKKARKQALRARAAEASGDDALAVADKDTEGSREDGGGWDVVKTKKKRSKTDGCEVADSAAGKKRKRSDGVAEDAEQDPAPEHQLQLEWTTPTPRPPLSVAQVRELLLHLLGGEEDPTWVRTRGSPPPVTLVILVDYLGYQGLVREREAFAFLSSLRRNSAVLRAPGTQLEVFSSAAELFTCPLQHKSRDHAEKDKKSKKSKSSEAVMFPTDILLSNVELMENKFPRCGRTEETVSEGAELPAGYVESKQAALANADPCSAKGVGKMLALDCEMCTTCEGLELTRVSLVDEKCKVMHDLFVFSIRPSRADAESRPLPVDAFKGGSNTYGCPRACVCVCAGTGGV